MPHSEELDNEIFNSERPEKRKPTVLLWSRRKFLEELYRKKKRNEKKKRRRE